MFTARLLYSVVFESYKPFNGQGGARLLLLTVPRLLVGCPEAAVGVVDQNTPTGIRCIGRDEVLIRQRKDARSSRQSL